MAPMPFVKSIIVSDRLRRCWSAQLSNTPPLAVPALSCHVVLLQCSTAKDGVSALLTRGLLTTRIAAHGLPSLLHPHLLHLLLLPPALPQSIVAKDGVSGLFTRGLTTRIAANGLQNICFTVLWNLVRLHQLAPSVVFANTVVSACCSWAALARSCVVFVSCAV